MSGLNYKKIAELLGGTVTEIEQPTFGGMSALDAAAERLRSVHDTHRRIHLSEADVRAIVRAFEEVRNGYEVDRVLVDPDLYPRFMARCREMKITASDTVINKRLQAVRKSGTFGLGLEPTTRGHGLHDAERYTYVAELAFSQLTYRPELSEDDVITNPQIGDEFSQIARSIEPHVRPMLVKWALVCLRKSRGSINAERAAKILALQPSALEHVMKNAGTLSALAVEKVPEEEGVFVVEEAAKVQRHLYVASSFNLREAVDPFRNAKPFAAIATPFWQPNAQKITLRYAPVPRHRSRPTARDWSWRLIQSRHPIFNIPVNLEPRLAA
ncbi:MAG TPA: hypothetical protein VHQ47_20825 [Phycisphaerae bacterium]|jgi:hypothetical protein|nr:hypothetical protein [Phycisphaerae bacterium]